MLMTTSEKMARNEKILRGEDPGPTKLQEWWKANKHHVLRPVSGLILMTVLSAAISAVAGVVYVCVAYPHVAVWTGAPLLLLALAYFIGVMVE